MPPHHRINYIEFPATSMPASKAFYAAVFGFTYTDYGPDYAAFHEAPNPDDPNDSGLDGGLTTMGPAPTPGASAPLVVFYSDNLEATCEAVSNAGGTITKSIFDFPGGRRFHFADPAGNELAVWGPPSEED